MNTDPRCAKEVSELLESGAFVHVLNTSIIPPGADGNWMIEEVSADYAQRLVQARDGFVFSHVGHQATAEAATEVLGVPVQMDRSPWNGTGLALAVQLNGRLPEGQILNREELERMGYALRVLFRRPAFLVGWNLEPGNVLGPWEELGRAHSFPEAKELARDLAKAHNVTRASAVVVMVWAEGTCPSWACTIEESDLHGSFRPTLQINVDDHGPHLQGVKS